MRLIVDILMIPVYMTIYVIVLAFYALHRVLWFLPERYRKQLTLVPMILYGFVTRR